MRTVLILFLLMGSAAADSVKFYDGNKLYFDLVVCGPAGARYDMTEENITRTQDCHRALGYTMGVLDSLRAVPDVITGCMSAGIDNY